MKTENIEFKIILEISSVFNPLTKLGHLLSTHKL